MGKLCTQEYKDPRKGDPKARRKQSRPRGTWAGGAGAVAVASGALSAFGPPRHPGTARPPRFTSKNKHVPQAGPVRRERLLKAGFVPAPPPPRPRRF